MGQFPSNVKNVTVYPYISWPPNGGTGPVILPLLTGASGVATFGTLGRTMYYNLSLSGGKLQPKNGKIELHGKYIATGEYENGEPFKTPVWELCTQAGPEFMFGRTISPVAELSSSLDASTPQTDVLSSPMAMVVPPYNILGPLTDISVTASTGDFTPLVINLIENGTGSIIGTKVGAPHLMGVRVDSGKMLSPLHVGMDRITITGKTKDGQLYTATSETCFSASFPCIFFRTFP
jgi:hypothetical protein